VLKALLDLKAPRAPKALQAQVHKEPQVLAHKALLVLKAFRALQELKAL
jgi:hypothetical protein